jgi:steroid delta-isomerase-like uncharacterized protein
MYNRTMPQGDLNMTDQTRPTITTLLAGLLEAWNAHDAARVMDFYAPDYTGTDASQPGLQRGPAEARQTVERYLQAFPDLRVTQDQLVLCGEQAAIQMTVRGTHRGSILHIPATGRETAIQGVAFLEFEQDKIVRSSYLWDVAGFLRAIGLLPDL